MSQSGRKKTSFFRRLSFSTGQQPKVTSSISDTVLRPQALSNSGLVEPPPIHDGSYARMTQAVPVDLPRVKVAPVSRNPIYPALASPPNSPPRNSAYRQGPAPNPTSPARYEDAMEDTSPVQKYPAAPSFPSPVRSPSSDRGISEARAYAQAIARARDPVGRVGATSAPPQSPTKSRPLPRPPSTATTATNSAKTDVPKPAAPDTTFIDFTRSPTLPPLLDPRENAIDRWAPLTRSDLPTRSTSATNQRQTTASSRRIVTSPILTSPHRPLDRGRTRLDLVGILSVPQIQATILSCISINTFLSLIGASDGLRKTFTGEMVGRWVMREWGVQIDKERGRSWPNLTVWEGFLESLLHDPATYSTYPPQWHSLLRHLSLSHTLIVLHLRNLPASAFPNSTLPFEDDTFPPSAPRSQVNSDAGSIAGSFAQKPPRKEHLVEIVMPEPLAGQEPRRGSLAREQLNKANSIGSSMLRRRSNSVVSQVTAFSAGPVPSGKAALPPVSYPTPKRYNFAPSTRTRTRSESSRPGSVFSVQSGPSVALSQWMTRNKQPQVSSDPRASFSERSIRYDSPVRRDYPKIEPAFDKPPPFVPGRAPILRVFVPMARWPSAEGAAAAVAELDKCGATRRMRLGDLVVNTACRPKTTEHVLLFVPSIKHLLVPLEYHLAPTGHLPSYLDGFMIPPSYYYPFLPSQIVFLNLRPYAQRAMSSVRLAYDRRDVTVASGARMSAKRYLYVAGFEISAEDPAAPEWTGMVSLEADGTAEGKAEMIRRMQAMGPWEIVREKSMTGTVWLRLIHQA